MTDTLFDDQGSLQGSSQGDLLDDVEDRPAIALTNAEEPLRTEALSQDEPAFPAEPVETSRALALSEIRVAAVTAHAMQKSVWRQNRLLVPRSPLKHLAV